jgi:integrase/recombinase XerD
MIEDMNVRNLSPATQRCYVNAVRKFARHCSRGLRHCRLCTLHTARRSSSERKDVDP